MATAALDPKTKAIGAKTIDLEWVQADGGKTQNPWSNPGSKLRVLALLEESSGLWNVTWHHHWLYRDYIGVTCNSNPELFGTRSIRSDGSYPGIEDWQKRGSVTAAFRKFVPASCLIGLMSHRFLAVPLFEN